MYLIMGYLETCFLRKILNFSESQIDIIVDIIIFMSYSFREQGTTKMETRAGGGGGSNPIANKGPLGLQPDGGLVPWYSAGSPKSEPR